jgi:hypothetical protein
MRTNTAWKYALAISVLIGGLSGGACQESPTASEPSIESEAVLEAMLATIQDEYRAELIYQKVIEDFGSVRPFVNIINAEVRHSEAIAGLYVSRGLSVPPSQWRWEEIPAYTSLVKACEAGVQAEIDNAEIYDEYLDLELPTDVQRVFENNRRASIQNHLPSFQRCSR